jgi:hypothetical protein
VLSVTSLLMTMKITGAMSVCSYLME